MGNRAVIAFESMPEIGIYLHWNGGRDSVQDFLDEAKRRELRTPGGDALYAFGRFVQVVGDALSAEGNDNLSMGVGTMARLDTDNGDNGTYWIGDAWEISRHVK